MNRTLLKKSLREAQWLLLGCAAALFAFCTLRVWIVSRLSMERFQRIIELLPNQWQRFTPVPFEDLISYTGRIALTYDEPLVVMLVSTFAIARGSDCVSGELGRGSMEMLLAQPVSRTQVILTPALVTVLGTAVLAATCWIGTAVGIEATTAKEPAAGLRIFGMEVSNPFAEPELVAVPMSSQVDRNVYIPAAFNLFSLGFFFAGLATFMSSWDRYRWRTIGIVVAFYIIQVIVKLVGMSAEEFSLLESFSIFTAYEPELFVNLTHREPHAAWAIYLHDAEGNFLDLGPLGYDLIFLGLGLVCFVGAVLVFNKRDLPAPL